MKLYYKSVLVYLILAVSLGVNAQVKYSVEYDQNNNTFTAGIYSETVLDEPYNRSSNLQFVFKFSEQVEETKLINLTSLIDGIDWLQAAKFKPLDSTEEFELIAIAMNQLSTTSISIVANEFIPLFSFQMKDENCFGIIELIRNDSEEVSIARASQLNFTQNFSVLGFGGNAFNGFVNETIICNDFVSDVESLGDELAQVSVYPNPTIDYLFVGFSEDLKEQNLNLDLYNVKGERIVSNYVEKSIENGNYLLDVSELTAGTYVIKIHSGNRIIHKEKVVLIK